MLNAHKQDVSYFSVSSTCCRLSKILLISTHLTNMADTVSDSDSQTTPILLLDSDSFGKNNKRRKLAEEASTISIASTLLVNKEQPIDEFSLTERMKDFEDFEDDYDCDSTASTVAFSPDSSPVRHLRKTSENNRYEVIDDNEEDSENVDPTNDFSRCDCCEQDATDVLRILCKKCSSTLVVCKNCFK